MCQHLKKKDKPSEGRAIMRKARKIDPN